MYNIVEKSRMYRSESQGCEVDPRFLQISGFPCPLERSPHVILQKVPCHANLSNCGKTQNISSTSKSLNPLTCHLPKAICKLLKKENIVCNWPTVQFLDSSFDLLWLLDFASSYTIVEGNN